MQQQMWHRFVGDLSALGGLPAYVLFTIAAFVLGERTQALGLLLALVLCMGIVVLLRLLLPAARPMPRTQRGLVGRIDAASFPSMHAARAGILAAMSALAYGWPLAGVFALVLVLVCFSRLWLGEHYLRDVVVGAALGIFSALVLTLI